jgi:glycosyltransferase 2 family protein
VISRLTRSLWVRGLVTIIVLAVLASRVGVRESLDAALRLDLRAALAVLGLVATDRMFMILRWMILLRARRVRVSAKSAVWIYLVSSFFGAFLPAGVGADAARAYALSRRIADGSQAVASVAVDRFLGLLSILIMGVAGVLVVGGQMESRLRLPLTGIAVAAVAGASAFLWADYWVRVSIPRRWHESRTAVRLLRLADELSEYRGHRATLFGVFLLSISVQILRILQAYLLGRGIGINVPFSYYLLFMPVGLIALMMPISISGFGAPQGIIVWLLQPQGVPEAQALALSTLIVLSGIAANLPGAWLYLRAYRSSRAAG